MRPRSDTDRQTDRRAWPLYISRRLRLTRDVIAVIFSYAICTRLTFLTFRVSHRRREMSCGHAHLCVSVCLSVSDAAACLCYCTEPDVTWGIGRDAPSYALLGGFTCMVLGLRLRYDKSFLHALPHGTRNKKRKTRCHLDLDLVND